MCLTGLFYFQLEKHHTLLESIFVLTTKSSQPCICVKRPGNKRTRVWRKLVVFFLATSSLVYWSIWHGSIFFRRKPSNNDWFPLLHYCRLGRARGFRFSLLGFVGENMTARPPKKMFVAHVFLGGNDSIRGQTPLLIVSHQANQSSLDVLQHQIKLSEPQMNGGFQWWYPNLWMVYFMENATQMDDNRGYPHDIALRKAPYLGWCSFGDAPPPFSVIIQTSTMGYQAECFMQDLCLVPTYEGFCF